MASNLKIFDATLPFLGGKRRMAEEIASHFQGETLCDVFMGGGSISLKAKQKGLRVLANDIAYRSKIVGDSLVANNTARLTDEDVCSLFIPNENDNFISKNYVPKIFIPSVAEFLDTAFTNARKKTGIKKELSVLLLSKFILSLRQYGAFQVGRQDNEMLIENREIELLELASESRGKKIKYNMAHPLPSLLNLKDQINSGIFNNGKDNEMHQMDCFDFLQLMKDRGEVIDTAYFDSPYFNSTKYSDHYKVLDEILEGKTGIEIADKAFNTKDVMENFEKLFLFSKFIPKWIISMGYNPSSDAGIKGEELLRVVQKFREADLYFMEHAWAINNIASKNGKRQSENVEYLIVTK
ncbi:MAG: DNA adenine methylase [Candidatus Moraniibacteriota bacterium]